MAGFKRNRAGPVNLKAGASADDLKAALEGLVSVLAGQDDEINKLNGGLELGVNTVGRIKKVSFLMPASPPYADVTLFGTNFLLTTNGPMQQLMEPGGVVRHRGGVQTNPAFIAPAVGVPSATQFGTAPLGLRPATNLFIPAVAALAAGGFSAAGVSITTAGVMAGHTFPAANWNAITFDGSSYHATSPVGAFQFSGGGWPLVIDHGFETPCKGVVCLGFRAVEAARPDLGIGTPLLDWQDTGKGSVKVSGVWGLPWGRRFELILYMTPETAT